MTVAASPAPAEAARKEGPADAASARTAASSAAAARPRVTAEVLLSVADMTLVLLITQIGRTCFEEGRQSCPRGARARRGLRAARLFAEHRDDELDHRGDELAAPDRARRLEARAGDGDELAGADLLDFG